MPINNQVWLGPDSTLNYIRELEATIEKMKAAIRELGGKI